MRFFYVIILVVFGLEGSANAFDIKQISCLEGLSKNTVHAICVDQIGNMWIGTSHGLNRYDGREVHNYYHIPGDSCSILSNEIDDIFKCKSGELWIVTSEGICSYDYAADQFYALPIEINHRGMVQVLEDSKYIWIFDADNDIVKIDKSENTVETISSNLNETLRHIDDIVEFDDHAFALVSRRREVFLLNKTSLKIKRIWQVKDDRIVKLCKGENGLYVATTDNIFHISSKGKIIKQIPGVLERLNRPIVLGLSCNHFKKNLWLNTDGDGIFVFDEQLNLVQHIQSGVGVNGILPDNAIRNLYFHDYNTTILGTVRAGVVIMKESQFREFRNLIGPESGSITYSVNSITEDEDGVIWLGTDGGGLKRYNVKEESFSSYFHPDIMKITTIVNYTNDYLLVATYLKGAFLFNKHTKQFIPADKHPVLKHISDEGLIRVFEDATKHVWIASWKDLARINPYTGSISYPLKNADALKRFKSPQPYTSASQVNDDMIWFCAEKGLIGFSLSQNRFIDEINLKNSQEIRDKIYGVDEDQNGNLIFAAGNSLYQYNDQDKGVSDLFGDKDRIHRVFHSLYCNSKGEIWAGTTKGLVRIDRSESSINVREVNKLGEVGGSEFRHGSVQLASNGLLYMGNNNGLTVFNPEEIVFDDAESVVTISSVTSNAIVDNAKVSELLALNVTDSISVEAKYSPTTYNFKFSTFSFLDEEHTEYAYKLENFDDIWYRGNFQQANYSSLPPGNYIFKVKATNQNGIMGEKTTDVFLTILPAWYQTLWFKIACVLIIMAIVIVVWMESLNRAKLKNQLAYEKMEQDKLKEINQMKLRFFTNISHELKTPLTLILGPLEHFIRGNSKSDDIAGLFPFLYRNAKRMSLLITQLLEFRKAEMAALELYFEKADIIEDCNEVINHFKHQTEIEGIAMSLKSFASSYRFVYDRDKLFKILFNLLSNALKHTSKGDKIVLEVNEGENNTVVIVVKDTGTGIPKDKLTSIFDRFYQADHNEAGTGIGMAYTKKLVELHGGDIEVDSVLGEGTSFTVRLPHNVESKGVKQQEFDVHKEVVDQQTMIYDLADDTEGDESKPLILVVEDEWDLRKYLVQFLNSRFTIIEASNGKQALDLAVERIPDIILSDVMMPVMDGYELCEKVKGDLRISHIPVLLLTAKAETEHKLKGYKTGADAYVEKPFDNNILLSQLEAILQNRRLLKERFGHELDLQPEEISPSHKDEKFLHKAISIVEMNMENSNFGVADFVEGIGMSRTLVYNKTKAITGKTINEFILHIRMRRASQLLMETNKSVTEIAIGCGFSDQSYFSTVFKKYFSMTPSQYREK